MEVQGAIVVTLMSGLAWHHTLSFHESFFLCDEQGDVRLAFLYADRPC